MVHKIDIIPTVHKDLNPYNYKRVRRLSRMSGVPEETVMHYFMQEYARIIEEAKAKGAKDTTHLDSYQLSQLYGNVTSRLGVADNSLIVKQKSATSLSKSFEMKAHLSGFDIPTAERYMTEVGYSSNFIQRLKNSPRIELIHYPKYLHTKYKKAFNVFFEKQVLTNKHKTEHAIVFYARTVALFITTLFKAGKDPFSTLIKNASVLPVSALQSLYRYKFNVVARYAYAVQGFRIEHVAQGKVSWANVTGRKFQNFNSIGTIYLFVRAKQRTDMSPEKQFYATLDEMGKAGELLKKKPIVFKTEKGVTLVLAIDKNGGKPCLSLRYRIDVTPQFTFDGVDKPEQWVNTHVIGPALKEFESNAMYHGRIKVGV